MGIKKIMKKLWLFFLLLFSAAAYSNVVVKLETPAIKKGENVILSVSTNYQNINYLALYRDFYISKIKGPIKNDRIRTWHFTLTPRSYDKEIVIPRITDHGSETKPVVVGLISEIPKSIKVSLSSQVNSAYIDEAIPVTLKITMPEIFSKQINSLQFKMADSPNLTVEDVKDEKSEVKINGENFVVHTFYMNYFFSQKGNVSTPKSIYEIKTVGDRRIYQAALGALKFHIKSFDEALKDHAALFAGGQLIASDDLDHFKDEVAIGDSLVRTITITGIDIRSKIMETPKIEENTAIKVRQLGVVSKKDDINGSGQKETRMTISYAYDFVSPGEINIRDLELPWLNINTGKFESTILPGKKIIVKDSVIQADTKQPQSAGQAAQNKADNASSSVVDADIAKPSLARWKSLLWEHWVPTLLIFLIISLLLILLIYRFKKQQRKPGKVALLKAKSNPDKILSSIRWACWRNKAVKTRLKIDQYLETRDIDIKDLDAQSKELQEQISILDTFLYGKATVSKWKGRKLWSALKKAVKTQHKVEKKKSLLKKLYPR